MVRALFQSLVQQDKAIFFPVQALDTVSPPSAKQEQRVGKRIQFKLLLDEARQTIYALAQIRVAAGDLDLICTGEVIQHKIERLSPLEKPSCKVRFFAQNHSCKYRPKVIRTLTSQVSFLPHFNFPHKRPTFAFAGESGYTLAFAQRIAHKGSHAETRAFSPSATMRLCATSEIPSIPSRFYIHTFPGSL